MTVTVENMASTENYMQIPRSLKSRIANVDEFKEPRGILEVNNT